jgi:hypothetical protein
MSAGTADTVSQRCKLADFNTFSGPSPIKPIKKDAKRAKSPTVV